MHHLSIYKKSWAYCLAFFMSVWPLSLNAAVHYVNQGIRYHLGDDRLATTRDKNVVATYPKIGTRWEQDFIASKNDQVEVILERLWGVDAANQRIIEVLLDGAVIGEITQGEEGPWRSVIKAFVFKGKKHTLAIETYGLPDPDDFVFEGVKVRSFNGARIQPVGKARVLAAVLVKSHHQKKKAPFKKKPSHLSLLKQTPLRREAPCHIAAEKWTAWRPDTKKGQLKISVGQERVVETDPLYRLPRGRIADFYFRIQDLPHGAAGKHRLEIRVGEGQNQAWSFELEALEKRKTKRYSGPIRVNHLLASAKDPLDLKKGWNKVTLHYCKENFIWLKINEKVFTQAAPGWNKKPVKVKAFITGIEMDLSARAR